MRLATCSWHLKIGRSSGVILVHRSNVHFSRASAGVALRDTIGNTASKQASGKPSLFIGINSQKKRPARTRRRGYYLPPAAPVCDIQHPLQIDFSLTFVDRANALVRSINREDPIGTAELPPP